MALKILGVNDTSYESYQINNPLTNGLSCALYYKSVLTGRKRDFIGITALLKVGLRTHTRNVKIT